MAAPVSSWPWHTEESSVFSSDPRTNLITSSYKSWSLSPNIMINPLWALLHQPDPAVIQAGLFCNEWKEEGGSSLRQSLDIVNGTDFNWRNVMPRASQMKPWSSLSLSLCGCWGGLGFTLMTHAKQTLNILAGLSRSVLVGQPVINIKHWTYYNWYHQVIREDCNLPPPLPVITS